MDPDIYLGNKLRQMKLDNDVTCWSMSLSKYVQDAANYYQSQIGVLHWIIELG